MAKHTYHFKHDFNARNDEKILDLRMDHDWAGYGIYWCLVEMLANADEYKLSNNYKRLSFSLRCDEAVLKSIIEDYDLFVVENDLFYSESLINRMKRLDEIKLKRAEAGAKGGKVKAIAKQTEAIAKQNQAEESKVKESKGDNKKKHTHDILTEYLGFWNESKCVSNYLPRSKEMKKTLSKNITAREKEIPDFKELFKKAVSSMIRSYITEKGWLTFGWCFKSTENAENLVSGKYNESIQMQTGVSSKKHHHASKELAEFIKNAPNYKKVPENLIPEYEAAIKTLKPGLVSKLTEKFGTIEEIKGE